MQLRIANNILLRLNTFFRNPYALTQPDNSKDFKKSFHQHVRQQFLKSVQRVSSQFSLTSPLELQNISAADTELSLSPILTTSFNWHFAHQFVRTTLLFQPHHVVTHLNSA
ncbi:hypothetical protein CDAR_27461 [Caerostris darwini]|uniref:Uncharacterized protein n=1 Tax=Caerostris darwini TaxID=1538125 RepID=A0AAV4VU48_9ARAC|nr:hypothetical protein CDAR_27461 [Caerostris darwini]